MANFLKNALEDIKESTKAQHEVDKASFSAAKAEAKAGWEEAKAMSSPERRKTVEQVKRDEQIAEAQAREAAAMERISAAKNDFTKANYKRKGDTTMANFLKNALEDIKESTKAQHEVDKASFSAAKAEAKAGWEEAKAMSSPERRKTVEQVKRDEQIAEAQARETAAMERISAAKNDK